MARAVLLAGGAAWLLAAIAGIGVALFGAGWLMSVLPPLAIDAGALGRAVGTFGAGLLAVALWHGVVLAGLRSATRWAHGAAILLAAVMAAALTSLGAAGITSAVAQPDASVGYSLAGVAALLGATAYGIAVVRFVAEVRAMGRG